jgi:arginyl-tRNA synthetase
MILRQSVGGDIIFDIEKSVSTEGDSGVYLQYAYVRAKSVLEKAKKENIGGKRSDLKNSPRSDLEEPTEIERLLYRFPEVILRSGEAYEMHHITNYLTELARSYNSFYGNTKILDKNDPASPYKVALTQAFSIIMKNGLDILGIPTPEKM